MHTILCCQSIQGDILRPSITLSTFMSTAIHTQDIYSLWPASILVTGDVGTLVELTAHVHEICCHATPPIPIPIPMLSRRRWSGIASG